MANEFIRKEILGGVPARRLNASIDNDDMSIVLTGGDVTMWPDGSAGKFVITIDRNEATEETILCTSRTGMTITVSNRGYDRTSASSHATGALVEHSLDANTVNQANRMANLLTGVGQIMGHNGTNPTAVPAGADGDFLAADADSPTGLAFAPAPAVVRAGSAPSLTATPYRLWWDTVLGVLRSSDGAVWDIPKQALIFANVGARTTALTSTPEDGILTIIAGQLAVSVGNEWIEIGSGRFANAAARDAYFTAPADGDQAYLLDVHQLTLYRVNQWIVISQKHTVSATPPANPQAGDLWLEPLT